MSLSHFTFTERAYPIVELGIGDTRTGGGGARWDAQRWDTAPAYWASSEPTWLDITCDVFTAECSYGRARSIDRFVAGTATLLIDNSTGWADPDSADEVGQLTVRPGRAIRFGVIHVTLGIRWLFRGIVDALVPRYSPIDTDTVELHCIDALGEVNRAKLVALSAPVGDKEGASARVTRILTAADWPIAKRDVRASGIPVRATDLGGQVADLLGITAESVGGVVFGDLDGNVAFRNRDWEVFEVGTPPDAIIGNVDCGTPDTVVPATPAEDGYLDPTITTGGSESIVDPRDRTWTVDMAGAIVRSKGPAPGTVIPGRDGDVDPISWVRPFERADIATRVILGRDGDDPWDYAQTDDLEGQALYGIEPYERTSLITYDTGYLTALSARILETRSHETAPRVRAVSFDGATHPRNVIDLMATVDVYKPSRYRCRFQLPDRLVFDEEYLATGVLHRLDPNRWTLDLNLDLAAPYAATETSKWDWSVWDSAQWSSGTLSSDIAALATRLAQLRAELAALTGATP